MKTKTRRQIKECDCIETLERELHYADIRLTDAEYMVTEIERYVRNDDVRRDLIWAANNLSAARDSLSKQAIIEPMSVDDYLEETREIDALGEKYLSDVLHPKVSKIVARTLIEDKANYGVSKCEDVRYCLQDVKAYHIDEDDKQAKRIINHIIKCVRTARNILQNLSLYPEKGM